jgi:hypothetical protein
LPDAASVHCPSMNSFRGAAVNSSTTLSTVTVMSTSSPHIGSHNETTRAPTFTRGCVEGRHPNVAGQDHLATTHCHVTQIDRGRRSPSQPWCCCVPDRLSRRVYVLAGPRRQRGWHVHIARAARCHSANGPGPGGSYPKTELRSHRHHQHHDTGAPGQLERYETPDPLRSNAVEPRIQCIR